MDVTPTASTAAAPTAVAATVPAAQERYWFWLDLEMTGLDPQSDRILEAAAIVTPVAPALEVVATWESAVYQPPEVLEQMNDWCKKTHGASGLTARVPSGVSEAELDAALCALADRFWPQSSPAGSVQEQSAQEHGTQGQSTEGKNPQGQGGQPVIILCGNSIGQDRKFVDRYLPRFAARLHYRMLDVSSFKIAFQELYGLAYKKQGTHRALDDIRESIGELQFYLGHVRSGG